MKTKYFVAFCFPSLSYPPSPPTLAPLVATGNSLCVFYVTDTLKRGKVVFGNEQCPSLLLPVLSFLLSGQGTHALALALTLTFTLETHLYYSHALAVESVI